MPYVQNALSRDQSLFAFGDDGRLRNHTQMTTGDWVSSATGTFEVTNEHLEYPLFYSFRLQEENTSSVISLTLNNVLIRGVNSTLLNNYDMTGHALLFCNTGAQVNATLGMRSSRDASLISSSSVTTMLNPGIQTAVRTGNIAVVKNKSSIITSAYGNGSYIKYESLNTFVPGDSVRIYNLSTADFSFVSTTATVQYSTPSFFTVSSSASGYEEPSTAYVVLDNPTSETISQPFAQYAGEDLVASISFSITSHEAQPVYVTIPTIVEMNRLFDSWSTNAALRSLPQVYRDIDATSTPSLPIAKFIHSLTSGIEGVSDRYASIRRDDISNQPGYVDVSDSVAKSYFVDTDIVSQRYYNWLSQMYGQSSLYSSVYSNKAADYGATIKVRCATTANITIASALNGDDSIDGVTLATGDRVLVKNQTTASQNGIYIVGASPARWEGMSASSASISSISPVTPSLGYSQITTSAAHGFSAGDTVVIAGATPSGHNGEYRIYSVPTSTTFVVESMEVASATLSSATAKRAVDVDAADLIFVREGTVNKMTMWSASGASWPVIGTDSISFSVKQVAAKVATTGNITISTALNNLDTIDGVSLVTGDYVLVKNQTTASENGLYKVAATPVRAENMAATLSLSAGFRAYVWGSGAVTTETMFTLDDDGIVGTGALNFSASSKPFAWDDTAEFKLWQLSNKYFGHKAGSLESLEETVKRYLIGDKQVYIALNPPFEFTVYTLRDETLGIYTTSSSIVESELIQNALDVIRPLGFVINHSAVSSFDTFIIGTSLIGTGRLG